jgi:two-component system, NarL family, sensor kinase
MAAGLAAVAVLVTLGQFLQTHETPAGPIQLTAAVAISYTIMGTLVLLGSHGQVVGRLMVAAGGFAGLSVLGASWANLTPLAWLSQWTWWPPYGLVFLALLVFPDGRLPGRRWRWLAGLIAVGTTVATLALALAALDDPRDLLASSTTPISERAQGLVFVAIGAVALTMLGTLGVLLSLWSRWRQARDETRQQMACLIPAAVVLLLGLMVEPFRFDGAAIVAAVAVPAGMTVAVLRHRLYHLDTVLNRTIVWLVMTLLVVVGFIVTVALVRNVVVAFTGSSSYESLVATGLIAVTFEPVRRWVQRGVDRLLYGERDDPYRVLARLGDLLGRTPEPDAVLPLLTGTIANLLQVPYVGVEVDGTDGPVMLAEYGRLTTTLVGFDMVAHGELVGRLLAATRSPGSRFTPRENRLLTDLALQAAVAVETARLVRDLQSSRERLVVAREEERRRLRRDLHDGLGPTFAGMSMQLHTARKVVAGQRPAAEILDRLATDLRRCVSEVRRLVDQLRPASLDKGLEAALRAECHRFDSPTLSVRFHVDGSLDDLPAATEVVAYRIVSEALTNVTRHARASDCRVAVSRSEWLSIEVVDDGIGLGTGPRTGVGLHSLRERADELGGECVVGDAETGGTAVRVRLPATIAAGPLPAPRRSDSSLEPV